MRRLLCIMAICAFYMTAMAIPRYETGYTYSNLSMNEGQLPGSNVVAILNDGSQIWFGTRSGLVAISENGRNSWNYSLTPHDSICQDSSGTVWVTTDSGVFIYDPKISDLVMIYDRGGLFCCTVGEEVCIYGGNRLQFHPSGGKGEPRTIDFESSMDILSMAALPNGNVILGNYSGRLYLYNPHSGSLQQFCQDIHPNMRRIRCIEGVVYALSYGGGVYRYSLGGTQLGRIEGMDSDFITDLALFDGKIWICTDGDGIYVLDPATQEFSQLNHIQGDAGSFPTNALTTLYSDGKYGLWAGTVRYGAFNISKRFIHTYTDALMGSTRGLSEKCVVSILPDSTGVCWVGTDGQGINRFDPVTESFQHYPSTFGYAIPSICRYDGRQLLVTFFNKGLFLFDTVTAAVTPFTAISEEDSRNMFEYGEYPMLFSPRPDRIFIFSDHSFIHNPMDGTMEELTYENGKSLSGKIPYVWHNEKFLLLSRKESILINRFTDTKMHYLCSVPHGSVTAMSYDPLHSRIWTVVNRSEIGYFGFDEETFSTTPYVRLDSLNPTNISTLTSDSQGHLWVTTGSALYMYDQNSNLVKKFSNYDGYERNDILAGHSTLSDSGIFYVAGSSGLVMVNTGVADEPGLSETPVIRLSEIHTADRTIHASSLKAGKVIRIPWNRGQLSLDFSITGLHFQEDVEIKYTVRGESESTLTTSSRTLDLSSLSPGQYTITAECLWSGNSRTEEETIRIKLMPPWYRSVLAFVLAISGLLIGIVLITLKYARQHMPKADQVTERDKDFLRRFCEYVALNLDQDLSSEVLTRELGISRTSLFEKVKALTGCSLNDYVKRMRVEKAMSLLKDSEMNINEISDTVGFAYPRYFSTVFKEMTGESPTQYRKKHQSRQE